ncbi:hypothetical protein EI545_05460 [Tabrizicola piscis]|uniref:Uncharacterized protein n=1 Tax=Tabrizicola piscis TaxID=2494374 RepID=A0A3S8U448_9RHOB|nr:hypothetical protein [Tabrizicola piscis]AZL58335.1 hypothetical protein EI545_05460 [Tabrizicola piscis]
MKPPQDTTPPKEEAPELTEATNSITLPPEKTGAPNLARWFWGSIVIMATLTIFLTVVAALRLGNEGGAEAPATGAGIGSAIVPSEQSAVELSEWLSNAREVALEAVKRQIDPLLNDAYKPAYNAIPQYADFHFSVVGEYTELSAAAFGDFSGNLEEILFGGIDERLHNVGIELDNIFNSAFSAALNTSVEAPGLTESGLGSVTRQALQDAQERMLVTVPVSTAAAVGTAASLKVAATAIAKKIAAKLAIKAAAKTGGKWAVAVTGAGTGAAICSPTGPGAGFCAALGGVGAWFLADSAIVRIDEYWTRDEFEADLRKMIDDQKSAHRAALEGALTARAVAVHKLTSEIVQQHDFTLRQLSGIGNAEMCEIAADLAARYELMRVNLSARTPGKLASIQSAVSANSESLTLGPIVREIEKNLEGAALVTVSAARIEGNFPLDFRSDGDISGTLFVGVAAIDFANQQALELVGFKVNMEPSTQVSKDSPLSISFKIKQHGSIWNLWSDQFFGGAVVVQILDAIGTSGGLEHEITLPLPIEHDQGAESIEDVEAVRREQAGQTTVDLTLRFRAEPLAELQKLRGCQ